MANERDYLAEAHAIIKGETMLLPQVEHLKAIEAHYQTAIFSLFGAMGYRTYGEVPENLREPMAECAAWFNSVNWSGQ